MATFGSLFAVRRTRIVQSPAIDGVRSYDLIAAADEGAVPLGATGVEAPGCITSKSRTSRSEGDHCSEMTMRSAERSTGIVSGALGPLPLIVPCSCSTIDAV